MYDTLLNRYGDISFVMTLPMDEGLNLFRKATEKNFEKQVWERWLVDYSRMLPERIEFMSFKEYLEEIKKPPQPKDNRSDEEILDDAENILKLMKRSE